MVRRKQNSVQERAPARTMADVLTGKNGDTEKPSFLKKKKLPTKYLIPMWRRKAAQQAKAPLGNHVQDADTNVSNSEAPASNAIVPAQSPNVNTDGLETRLLQTVETVRDAAVTPDAVKQAINDNTENGGYRYIPESNADAVEEMYIREL